MVTKSCRVDFEVDTSEGRETVVLKDVDYVGGKPDYEADVNGSPISLTYVNVALIRKDGNYEVIKGNGSDVEERPSLSKRSKDDVKKKSI